MVIYTEFQYVFVPDIILSIKQETILHIWTQLTSLNTCVLHHGYIYRISVCFSSRYDSEYQTRNYRAYMTQLTSLNTCVLHHGYIYRISVYFSSRYNSEYQTKNNCIYDLVNVSKYLCITPLVIYTESLYVSVPGTILSIKQETIEHI